MCLRAYFFLVRIAHIRIVYPYARSLIDYRTFDVYLVGDLVRTLANYCYRYSNIYLVYENNHASVYVFPLQTYAYVRFVRT